MCGLLVGALRMRLNTKYQIFTTLLNIKRKKPWFVVKQRQSWRFSLCYVETTKPSSSKVWLSRSIHSETPSMLWKSNDDMYFKGFCIERASVSACLYTQATRCMRTPSPRERLLNRYPSNFETTNRIMWVSSAINKWKKPRGCFQRTLDKPGRSVVRIHPKALWSWPSKAKTNDSLEVLLIVWTIVSNFRADKPRQELRRLLFAFRFPRSLNSSFMYNFNVTSSSRRLYTASFFPL